MAQLFEQQARQTPDAVAAEWAGGTITYARLHARTDRLARRLTRHGVQPGDRVAVLMHHSPELVVTLLAVAKCGAAYVPLDHRYPASRMRSILGGAGCVLLAVDNASRDHEVVSGQRTLLVVPDGTGGEDIPEGTADGATFVNPRPDPRAVLYIMHTSGSTGEPKGVMVTHRNVLALALDRIWRRGAHTRVLLHSPYAFDASTYELWVPLLSGGRVVIADEEVNSLLLRRLAGAGRITALWLTAGLFAALAEGDPGCLAGAREVWTGGDVVSPQAVARVAAACPGIVVFNGYGPTETTTFATRYQIHPGPSIEDDVPIGAAMDHTRLYVLDADGRPVPPGTVGQLHVGGEHVARGYVGRPDLTRERFLPDPFGPPGSRMYATGDLVRWDGEGRLRYLGRVDDQVKIRGFRIEPGEIESLLSRHPQVSRAAVVAQRLDAGGGRITAYVVPADPGAPPEPEALRGQLAGSLPEYMVPAEVVLVPAIPLTANGKVDRRRLSDPGRTGAAGGTAGAGVAGGTRGAGQQHDPSPGVPTLVEQWVRRRPDACAVHDPVAGDSVTYAQLWRRSGELAGALAAMGVGRGHTVAVDLDRSVDLVVAFLGIARAGAAYLPSDTYAPPERVAGILAESGAVAAVVRDDTAGGRVPSSVRTLTAWAGGTGYPGDIRAPECDAAGEDPLYVTYTSGSTGRPKGVVVPHRAVVRLVTGARYCPVDAGDRVANTCNPAFDVTTCEIWSTLTAGGTVVPFPSVTDVSLGEWIALVRDQRITTMFLTTSLFHTVAWEEPDAFSTLRNLVVGGEQLDLSATRRVLAAGPPGRLVNGYGPTEATAFATYFECTRDSLAGLDRVPIGFALQQTSLHVLADDLSPVPAGTPGELCIGGPGVALGYLHRPELTAERFVTEPGTGELVYRTGDVVRELPGGALEMLGRRDRQVKLRGFRIELDEIEQAVVATGLADAAFVAKVGDGTAAQLFAAVLPDARSAVPAAELPATLPARLGERLPGYMVPSHWLVLDQLPIGPTGKADRGRIETLLTEEFGGRGGPADGSRGLETATERQLAQLWSELLEVPVTSGDASFWELGGHSLRGITLVARIRERLGVELRLRDLFDRPCLSDLAAFLDGTDTLDRTDTSGPSGTATAPVEVAATDFQQRIWVALKLEPEPALYNVPFAWRVAGELDAARLAVALARVVARHEALRTTFADRRGELRQVVGAPWRPVVHRQSCAGTGELTACLRAEADRPFDLATGPLLRAGLIDTPDGQILTLTVHHIVFDLSSLAILLDELSRYYADDTVADTAAEPAPKQYRDVVVAAGSADPAALDRWVKRLHGAPGRLPLDRPQWSEPPGLVPLDLPDDLLTLMRPVQARFGMSWFMVAAAALAGALHRWTGSDDLTFGFPTDIRSANGLDGVLGPCLNMVVVRSRSAAGTRLSELLAATRDDVLQAIEDQDVPFGSVVDALNPPRSAGSTPYLDVVLAPQVHPATPPEAGGCHLTSQTTTGTVGAVGKFAVTVGLTVAGDRLTGSLLYRGDRLSAAAAADLARAYVEVLGAAVRDPDGVLETPGPAGRYRDGAVDTGTAAPTVHSGQTPRGELERRVGAIWSALLGVEAIGADDNFFDAGGNSLKLVTLHAELCREFGVEVPIQRLFENCTVRTMARFLGESGGQPSRPVGHSLDAADRATARRNRLQHQAGRR